MRFPRSFIRAVLAALFVVAVPTSTALAQERVTVLLKNGEKHEQVTYKVLGMFNTLELQRGDQTIQVSFSDIESITDASGENIAPRLLGTRYRPSSLAVPGAGDPSRGTPAARESASPPGAGRPWRVALALDGGVDAPLGDYYEGARGGFGFGGTLHAVVTDDIALRVVVTRLGMDFERDFGLISLDPSVQIVSQDFGVEALRIQGGAEYHQSIRRAGVSSGFWFAHSSLGVIRHGLSWQATVREVSTGALASLSARTTDSRFAMTSGLGVVYRLTGGVGASLSGDVDFVWTKVYYPNGTTGTAIKGYVLGVRAGIALVL